jgi:hypothetical protein
LALVEGCKHSLEISIPVEEVESETSRVIGRRSEARQSCPASVPGKAPANAHPQAVCRRHPAEACWKTSSPSPSAKTVRGWKISTWWARPISATSISTTGEPLKLQGRPSKSCRQIELERIHQGVEVPYHDPESDRRGHRSSASTRFRETEGAVHQRGSAPGGRRRFRRGLPRNCCRSPTPPEGEPVKTGRNGAGNRRPRTPFEAFTENLRGAYARATKRNFRSSSTPKITAPSVWPARPSAFHAVREGPSQKGTARTRTTSSPRKSATTATVDELQARPSARTSSPSASTRRSRRPKNQIVDKLVDAHDFPVPEVFIERQIKQPRGAEPARPG